MEFVCVPAIVFASVVFLIALWVGSKCAPKCIPEKENAMLWPLLFANYVHAWIGSLGALYVLMTDPSVWSDPFFARSLPTQIMASICVGYLLVDFMALLSSGLIKTQKEYAFMHAVVFIGYVWYLCLRSGAMMVLVGLVGELGTLFVHHSRFMHEARWMLSHPRVFVVHEVFRGVSFPVTRLLPLSAMLAMFFSSATATPKALRRQSELKFQAGVLVLILGLNLRYCVSHLKDGVEVVQSFKKWREQQRVEHVERGRRERDAIQLKRQLDRKQAELQLLLDQQQQQQQGVGGGGGDGGASSTTSTARNRRSGNKRSGGR